MHSIYTLNETGAFIWDRIAEPKSFEELIDMIVNEYDITTEQAITDLSYFLDEMCEFGAVTQGRKP